MLNNLVANWAGLAEVKLQWATLGKIGQLFPCSRLL